MKNHEAGNNPIQLGLKVAVVFALAAAVFLMVYQYDNKYTAAGPKAKDGILTLENEVFVQQPVLFLVDGWEYYGNQLLTPADFDHNPPVPDQYLFIGRFGGFEMYGGSPHGCASYRLTIKLPEQVDSYLLELPEIFSAYRLYINGRPARQMGEPEPEGYRSETGNRTVSIEAGGNLEILFAVADYSHLYSGMVYPPAFGQPDAVSDLLSTRLVLRSSLCAVALTVGLLSVMVGLLGRKSSLALMFGLLCIFFVGYVSYPITRTLLSGTGLHYALENVSFCAMLGVAMLAAMRVSGLPRKWGLPFVGFEGMMCAVSAVLHVLLPLGNLNMMLAYSWLVSAYEWITAGFMAAAVWYALRKGVVCIAPLLYGVVIFVCALLADRLLPVYEPILGGWFIELASFALVLCIGAVTGQEVAEQYRESAVMTERAGSMERLYQSQLAHFETLKQEMAQIKTMRHDLRHHLTLLDEYVSSHQYDRLEAYIKEYHTSSTSEELPEYCPIDVINTLTYHYRTVAQQNHIHLDVRCNLNATSDPGHTRMTDSDLCCLYANLLENAVEACQRMEREKRTIRIAVFRTAADTLHIRVWNTAENVRPLGGRFLSSKKGGQTGYGLLSVEAIAERYGGKAEFLWDADKQEFESKVTVMA
ncbi:GHKL domain-containing protein [Aminipila butyrica]|uniref:GHKL domain-containing protein n=1 Tax=Aminipila butyrica TaxID=433296 RepID=A0A858BTU7_9FIRM|nr:GHKL domain-containing protein [Aminipila butyrica]QIB68987.1 GHKL domain-containing protein [Aminipila butyrica]